MIFPALYLLVRCLLGGGVARLRAVAVTPQVGGDDAIAMAGEGVR
jgi:hypothetical protein